MSSDSAEQHSAGQDRLLGELVADALLHAGRTVAVAESLTGGNLSAALSAIGGASDWFLGGVVGYAAKVKVELLGVPRGPVITATAAAQMAIGVARLLDADVAVSTTGVGGPGSREDQPAGTVFVAVVTPNDGNVHEYHFDGDPSEIVEQATRQALRNLAVAVARSTASSPDSPGSTGRNGADGKRSPDRAG